jgi:hypothetical protein
MNDIEAAIARVFAAQTAKDIEDALLAAPALFTPEADQILAHQQDQAQQQGNADLVAAIVEFRELLQSMRVASGLTLPDLPGSACAADLIHALIAVDPAAAVPPLALTPVFFAVRDALHEHATRNNLAPLLENLRGLDQRIAAAGGEEAMTRFGRTSIFSLIEEWVDVPTWIDSHGMLMDHSELLTPDALAIVTLLAAGARRRESPDEAAVLEQHVAILQSASRGKLEDAYIKLIEDEQKERGGQDA